LVPITRLYASCNLGSSCDDAFGSMNLSYEFWLCIVKLANKI
jgi:hypothetical protein